MLLPPVFGHRALRQAQFQRARVEGSAGSRYQPPSTVSGRLTVVPGSGSGLLSPIALRSLSILSDSSLRMVAEPHRQANRSMGAYRLPDQAPLSEYGGLSILPSDLPG